MPAYSRLRTFIDALKTGKTHIATCLDDFFHNPASVQANPHYGEFSTGNWSAATPAWLSEVLDSMGLTAVERDHVLRWPLAELERTRAAAAGAVAAGRPVAFFWGLYDGDAPTAVPRQDAAGNQEVLFQSPSAALRLTQLNYGEVYVEEV